jgi:MazG family protein
MKEFNRLIRIMKKLRNPEKGCPWDLEQTEKTLKEYIIEEAYELIEAIDAGSARNQLEELGDLLLQIVFISQINQEKRNFSIKDVINHINHKLISRHPHIFSRVTVKTAEEVKTNWEKIKKEEKNSSSIISDYPEKMPALMIAKRIAEKAASIGFDWQDTSPSEPASLKALAKAEEEIGELKRAIVADAGIEHPGRKTIQKNKDKISEEIGDVLFAVTNIARHLDINPEFALKKTNEKFKKRFRFIEVQLKKKGKDIHESDLEEMEALWQESKIH